jgi:hypothetical protein
MPEADALAILAKDEQALDDSVQAAPHCSVILASAALLALLAYLLWPRNT